MDSSLAPAVHWRHVTVEEEQSPSVCLFVHYLYDEWCAQLDLHAVRLE